MGRVVCSRWQSFEIRFRPEGFVCAFSCRGSSGACLELPAGTSHRARRWGLVAEYFPVRHHDKPGRARFAVSPVCHVIPRFGTCCLECCRIGFSLRVTPSLHLVTLTLHACNVKKISVEGHSVKSRTSRVFACNVGKIASIFHENTQVSCAVYSSIGRLMLKKIRTSYFPSSLSSLSVIVHDRVCCQSVLPCRASCGGAS